MLPSLLLPLCSPNQENISEEEMEILPEECQYLTPEHQQEKDVQILEIHLETFFMLAMRGGAEARRLMREGGTYPVVRELHLDIENEGVRRGCERLVDIIMGDEAVGGYGNVGLGFAESAEKQRGGHGQDVGRMITQRDVEEEDDEDNQVVPIF